LKVRQYILIVCIPIIVVGAVNAVVSEIVLSKVDIDIDDARTIDGRYLLIQTQPKREIEVDRKTYVAARTLLWVGRLLLIPILVSIVAVGGVIVYTVLANSAQPRR
jgi:hypothetical protein